MQQPDKFKDYAETVCAQLRWKKARPVVAREIETHLRDQYDALLQKGMPEQAAADETIHLTGDAVEIGVSLDRVHRPKPSWALLGLTGVLLLLGLGIHVFTAGSGTHGVSLFRHIAAAVLGCGCLAGAYFADFTLLGRRPLLFFAGAAIIVSGVILFDPRSVYGRSCMAAQLTLLLPLAYAVLLYRLRGKGYAGLALSLAGLGGLGALCCLVPVMAGTLILAVTGAALLAAAAWGDWFQIGKRRSLLILGTLLLLGTAAVLLQVRNSEHLMSRLETVLHPERDPSGSGFLGMTIREALSGARLLGAGATGPYIAGAPTLLKSPDFLLTYLIHRVGWISLIVILAVFAAFFAAAVRKCLKQKNMLGRLVSLAVILTLALQVLLHTAADLGFAYGTISLPLLSYGNTALVVNMALIGIMLSVFRTGSLVQDRTCPPVHGKNRFCWRDRLQWQNGVLTISFKKDIQA